MWGVGGIFHIQVILKNAPRRMSICTQRGFTSCGALALQMNQARTYGNARFFFFFFFFVTSSVSKSRADERLIIQRRGTLRPRLSWRRAGNEDAEGRHVSEELMKVDVRRIRGNQPHLAQRGKKLTRWSRRSSLQSRRTSLFFFFPSSYSFMKSLELMRLLSMRVYFGRGFCIS